MLILTRSIGQTIQIGDDIGITVLGIKGNQVRIGISAPESVPVHREEIFNRIRAEEAVASNDLINGISDRVFSGEICNLNPERGFGFIYSPGLPDNVFFHANGMGKGAFSDLEEGSSVEFQIEIGPKGPVAVKVSVKDALAAQAG